MKTKSPPFPVSICAISIAVLIAIIWILHCILYFHHDCFKIPLEIGSKPLFVFPSLLLLLVYILAQVKYPSFTSSLGLTITNIVGAPILLFYIYLIPMLIYNALHPKSYSGGIMEVAYDIYLTLDPISVFEGFAILVFSIAALLSRRCYARWQTLLLIAYWSSGLIKWAFIFATWRELLNGPLSLWPGT